MISAYHGLNEISILFETITLNDYKYAVDDVNAAENALIDAAGITTAKMIFSALTSAGYGAAIALVGGSATIIIKIDALDNRCERAYTVFKRIPA